MTGFGIYALIGLVLMIVDVSINCICLPHVRRSMFFWFCSLATLLYWPILLIEYAINLKRHGTIFGKQD